ncbi:hypothetical protein PL748_08380 [Bifidobacterium bifidum]|uniref:hypothetical protein n=1 Tax=Bifidobacterium bifidum TaxID=1681 RepID=UPI00232C1F6A|nr:hypothetical protein [Bifidobacterium bifidum]MDB1228740.1 hypothetical protein [Bifidobacterium bifidum]MDB1232087.1 hypothetical protein [Bifidobacterium bifidum]MDB1239714.1 hypothetical protein [Bifidobacterium bifidum]MDB1244900.1 hypothetical protein [Bifidobacterium bifidum]MDB1247965.1 hypothetical protein [Bifidobacterium bifidum]
MEHTHDQRPRALKYDTVVAHGDTSPGSFPVRVERKENGIDLTYERQAFQGTRHRIKVGEILTRIGADSIRVAGLR